MQTSLGEKERRASRQKKIQTSLVYYLQIKEKEGLENASEEELCALLKENILQSIKTCYLQTKENNVDVFSLKEILCKRYGYNPTDLDFKEIEWKVKVTVILR